MADPTTTTTTTAPWASESPRVIAALGEIGTILVPGETVHAYAIQRRLFALIHRRMILVATSGRFLGIRRGLFGGFTPVDVRWQDVKDAKIDIGSFGATISLLAFDRPDMAMSGMPGGLRFGGMRPAQAQDIYRICQSQEQAWREKRRVRELEELRAKSGGIQMGFGGASGGTLSTPDAAGVGMAGATARLEQAKEMLTKGLISDAEYESLKARIISGL